VGRSKVIAVLPTELRFEFVVGVAAAAALFVLAHVPRVLTDGIPAADALATHGVLLLVVGGRIEALWDTHSRCEKHTRAVRHTLTL
jgi:hypothetical protein